MEVISSPVKVSSEGSFQPITWQLLSTTPKQPTHTSTYSRIQQQTKNLYYATIHNEYMQENPRLNRQDRRKVTFHGSAYPTVWYGILEFNVPLDTV